MDFFTLIVFLALFYLRPQEWVTDFNSLHPVQILSVLAFVAMAQHRNFKFKKLLQTPLDWLILCYFIWTLIAGFQPRQTLSAIQSLILFYFVAVCSLDSIPRLKKFLGWWCFFIFIIATMAILSQYGIDPLGSYDITEGNMKGRLILNLAVFNNPNALAHSVVPAVPLFYYLVYWRRVTLKIFSLLLIVPLYCIYLTQSKGAFLCGFATLLATLTFARSRIWQVIVIVLAVGFGYSALYMLPRMNELQNSRTDPAIQGRVAALTYGLSVMRTNWFGLGLGNFEPSFFRNGPAETRVVTRIIPERRVPTANGEFHDIDAKRIRTTIYEHYTKATHGAYNQNGAELGYMGLFLFVSILYCCVRTLLLVKSKDDDEERIRRALFVSVVAYAVSSWMVDFAYRTTFFMMVAAISAFHRHLLRKHASVAEPARIEPVTTVFPWLRGLPSIKLPGISLPGFTGAMPATASFAPEMAPAPIALASSTVLQPSPAAGMGGSGRVLDWHKPRTTLGETLRKKFIWTRLGIMDFVIMLALTYAAILYWEHLIATM
jgi:hypothetical protein